MQERPSQLNRRVVEILQCRIRYPVGGQKLPCVDSEAGQSGKERQVNQLVGHWFRSSRSVAISRVHVHVECFEKVD